MTVDPVSPVTAGIRRALACALGIPLLAGCAAERPADRDPQSLEALAAAWSGQRGDATCSARGPRGEYLGPVPGAQYCEWPVVRRGEVWGRVTGSQDGVLGLTVITWERVVKDSAELRAITDSLERAFTRGGLRAYACPDGGRRWQRDGLGVQLASLPSDRLLRPQFSVTATTLPAALPGLLCPEAPQLPNGRVRPSPRGQVS